VGLALQHVKLEAPMPASLGFKKLYAKIRSGSKI
jgi:hypothetical protein